MRNSQQCPTKAADRKHRVHEKLGALANIPRRAVYVTVEYIRVLKPSIILYLFLKLFCQRFHSF